MLRTGDGLKRVERSEGSTGPHQGAERLLALGAGEMEHHLIGADRSGAGQRFRQGPDRVVSHGENDDARLGDPGGRVVLGTNGELERLRHCLLAAAVEANVVAPPLPRPGERHPQSDPGATGPDDPHD